MAQGAALCLDISRLVGRAGRQLTGVDRVEIAYLDHFLARKGVVFGLCQTRFGVLVLDRAGLAGARDALCQDTAWGPIDIVGRLRRRASRHAMRAEATLRRLAIGRAKSAGAALHKLGADLIYINVGQTSIKAKILASLSQRGIESWVMLHDAIPVAHPHWHKDSVVNRFRATLLAVSQYADRVIYNSAATREDVSARLAALGRVPKETVALLGVDHLEQRPQSNETPLSSTPYCLCVGTLDARKNQSYLLDIWQGWEEPGRPDLILCGALGDGSESLTARLADPPQGVTWQSGVSDADIAALTQNAVCALFPSQAEGFGFPPAEALSLGTPVVCAPLPVYREVLGDKVVYAGLDDAYQWRKEIMKLAERGATLVSGTADLPTWEAHFNIVLSDA